MSPEPLLTKLDKLGTALGDARDPYPLRGYLCKVRDKSGLPPLEQPIFLALIFGVKLSQTQKNKKFVKHAILAKATNVKKQGPSCVAVQLESNEFDEETVIVSAGLDRERTRIPGRTNVFEATPNYDNTL